MAAKLAALVTLLAFVSPAACLGTNVCFVGWLPIVSSLLCSPRLRSRPSPPPSGSELRVGYYGDSNNQNSYCPSAETTVRRVVEDAIFQDRGIGAALIRLFFHDCFVRGCDASVLLNTTNSKNSDTEREGPPNKDSLRGFEVIDTAKEKLNAECNGNKVSCADILAFAARDASKILSGGGNFSFPMPAGRYDGRESFADETDQLPGPGSNFQQLEQKFMDQGLDANDMITLSGAHTIGRARCLFFKDRLSSMDAALAAKLRKECNGNDDNRVDQDSETPDVLDSQYYRNVIGNKVLFASDDALRPAKLADDYANNRVSWESAFAKAMVKMGNVGVRTRPDSNSEIRKQCWSAN
ncbi:peroxidase 2-like [Phragmites australis]|uniref:peroxidase 2-like n=1 Tax=Phragmites australis TaxID=29695 RepID=UPI002D76B336|nr:peroxidase 2-like [Phragmites australis]